jgi:hypothetical protein
MGNAFVAQTSGASSSYWNPAGLMGVNKWMEVSFMHAEYFAGIANYDQLSLAHTINEKSALGFTAIRFGVDDIPNTTQLIDNNGNINYDNVSSFSAGDYAFIFSYARKLPIEGMTLGGSSKIIYRRVGDFARSWGFGIDAGWQYQVNSKLKFGAMLRDATSTFNAWTFSLDEETKNVFLNTGNEIPQNGLELTLPKMILGVAGNLPLTKNGFTIGGEIDFDITTDGRRNRAGVTNLQYTTELDNSRKFNLQPNIGLGVALKGFHLDYAFTDIGDASVALYSHIISLRLKLDKPKNAIK